METEKASYGANFGVSTKGIVLNSEGKLLTIRRTETAPSNPLKWDFPGGVLESGEDPSISLIREIKEEAGLDAAHPELFDAVVFILEEVKLPWITLCYIVKSFSGSVTLSYEHDLVKWVTPEEFLVLPFSLKLQKIVKKLIDIKK